MGNAANGYAIILLGANGQRYNPRLIMVQITSNDFDDNLSDRCFGLDTTGQLIELSPLVGLEG